MRIVFAAFLLFVAACGAGTDDTSAVAKEDTPPLYNYSSVKTAMTEAQSTVHIFWEHHADWGPGEDGFRVKILQTSDEYERDYVWVEYLQDGGAPGEWRGDFDWHSHADEDEMFLVVKGKMRMAFRDRTEIVGEGEFIIVPRGVEHRPGSETEECHVLLFEPATTVNTGDNRASERTVTELEEI